MKYEKLSGISGSLAYCLCCGAKEHISGDLRWIECGCRWKICETCQKCLNHCQCQPGKVRTVQAQRWLAWIPGLSVGSMGLGDSEAEAIWELAKKSALGSMTVLEELEKLRPRFKTLEDKEYFLKIRRFLGEQP